MIEARGLTPDLSPAAWASFCRSLMRSSRLAASSAACASASSAALRSSSARLASSSLYCCALSFSWTLGALIFSFSFSRLSTPSLVSVSNRSP